MFAPRLISWGFFSCGIIYLYYCTTIHCEYRKREEPSWFFPFLFLRNLRKIYGKKLITIFDL
nr:MAG TPA: hypothetical protein [Bacteriophage sp.]DAX68479.1 MAG TPA: hypothetical protein [Caudoviricetes sp.]DAX87159.1 MAG TPA: hypothetical protein [Caudoviricetes sp.]